MIVELRDETGVAVIEPLGRLDARTAGTFRQRLATLVEEGKSWVVADLSRVDFVDSVGLAALVSGLKMARSSAGDLRLAGLQDPVRVIFEITRLHRAFDIYDTLPEAVHSFLHATEESPLFPGGFFLPKRSIRPGAAWPGGRAVGNQKD